jgi:DNA-binding PadR family transcriptional regulator
LEKDILDNLHERLLKAFMDIVIMRKLVSAEMSGYAILKYIHRSYEFLISSGTIYSILYSMERDGLIKGTTTDRKRVYTLTPKGKKIIKIINQVNGPILNFVTKLLVPDTDARMILESSEEISEAKIL